MFQNLYAIPVYKTKLLEHEKVQDDFAEILEQDEHFKNLVEITIKDYENENITFLQRDVENLPYSLDIEETFESLRTLYNVLYKKIVKTWELENKEVINVGGLFVLGTERSETRRIDDQLRGRAGRQGDPGKSQFYVSLEDDLIKIFGGDGIKRWVDYLIDDKDTPLESNILTQSLENAQKKVELFNYEMRN